MEKEEEYNQKKTKKDEEKVLGSDQAPGGKAGPSGLHLSLQSPEDLGSLCYVLRERVEEDRVEEQSDGVKHGKGGGLGARLPQRGHALCLHFLVPLCRARCSWNSC